MAEVMVCNSHRALKFVGQLDPRKHKPNINSVFHRVKSFSACIDMYICSDSRIFPSIDIHLYGFFQLIFVSWSCQVKIRIQIYPFEIILRSYSDPSHIPLKFTVIITLKLRFVSTINTSNVFLLLYHLAKEFIKNIINHQSPP